MSLWARLRGKSEMDGRDIPGLQELLDNGAHIRTVQEHHGWTDGREKAKAKGYIPIKRDKWWVESDKTFQSHAGYVTPGGYAYSGNPPFMEYVRADMVRVDWTKVRMLKTICRRCNMTATIHGGEHAVSDDDATASLLAKRWDVKRMFCKLCVRDVEDGEPETA